MASEKKSWDIELSESARRQLRDLDNAVQKRILTFLQTRLAPLGNPRSIGEALKGERFGEFWKYRVGDYRIVAKIEDRLLKVLVVTIGHRREVYR